MGSTGFVGASFVGAGFGCVGFVSIDFVDIVVLPVVEAGGAEVPGNEDEAVVAAVPEAVLVIAGALFPGLELELEPMEEEAKTVLVTVATAVAGAPVSEVLLAVQEVTISRQAHAAKRRMYSGVPDRSTHGGLHYPIPLDQRPPTPFGPVGRMGRPSA
ncbi:MAG: hypothetical protein ACR2M5_08115 [Nakamurella sp.]